MDQPEGRRELRFEEAGRPLDLDEFLVWLTVQMAWDEVPSPSDRLDDLLDDDLLEHYRLLCELDRLTGDQAEGFYEACRAETVRDLHLHYLWMISVPFGYVLKD